MADIPFNLYKIVEYRDVQSMGQIIIGADNVSGPVLACR
jgi:hypothetical protein